MKEYDVKRRRSAAHRRKHSKHKTKDQKMKALQEGRKEQLERIKRAFNDILDDTPLRIPNKP